MPNWYNDYDDRDTPDDNDVAIIAERERKELKSHITALPSHCNPGSYYIHNNVDSSYFLNKDLVDIHEFEDYYLRQCYLKQQTYQKIKSTANLNNLPPPVCNSCNTPMTPRMGRFGKFYFCNNGCESQPTISDKAWRLYNEAI